ncbi:MAG: hypothetical protein QOC66_3752 [Pseudonocardiales bacterium]|jgi:uncharacterized protein (DUF885 family)|nr:hypothetical protein [Pseudonocardiales bacterium]
MTTDTAARQLAQTLVDRLLAADPFAGTGLGLREYDALVPDPSAAAEDRLAADLGTIATQARSVTAEDEADAVTLDVVTATCERRRRSIDARMEEFTVTAMPIAGPPALFAVLARTVLPDPEAAADYLERVRASVGWLDATTQRLREGADRGRYAVGSLVDEALGWTDRTLAMPVPLAITAPTPPEGWDGAADWRTQIEQVARDGVVPAVARWREVLTELRPQARADEAAGVGALPDGPQAYENAIAVHTTLPLTADELHRIGLDEVARLEDRARELGARIGLADLDAVRAAVRASTSALDPEIALADAQAAVVRAEARAAEIMPLPLPEPCAVSPMPQTVAEAGMAPHYTRPRQDGSRPGTYWFNTLRPTAGTGWDLEAVAFHETVPGHHSQLARLQRLTDLPLLQQLSITVHAEGWGLYAERLAGEFGLYSGVEAEIGAVYVEMHRAARLVVDTGLHAFGWSRQQARSYLLEHVALSEGFLTDEIDRYIVWPGQALAYLVGQREILRLRDRSRAALGDRFDLPAFNGALLDSGNLPMPVLDRVIEDWVATR